MGPGEAAQDNGVTDMASEPRDLKAQKSCWSAWEWCVPFPGLTVAIVNTCSGPRGHCSTAHWEVTGSFGTAAVWRVWPESHTVYTNNSKHKEREGGQLARHNPCWLQC